MKAYNEKSRNNVLLACEVVVLFTILNARHTKEYRNTFKPQTNRMDHEKIQWSAPEYEHKKHSVDWFWAVGIIALSLAVTAIIYRNILFAVFILLGAFTLLLYSARKPQVLSFELNQKGMRIGSTLYPYHTLKSFWLRDDDRGIKLILESQKTLMPHMSIPLSPEMDKGAVHTFLLEYLPEEEQKESVSEALMDYLGF